jgi:multiple sugar transport system permease protein
LRSNPLRNGRFQGTKINSGDGPLPYFLVSPLLIFILILALVPAVFTVVSSFYRVQPLNPPTKFYGFNNFRNIWHDSSVLLSLGNTALYIVIGVSVSMVLGLLMAVSLQKPFKGRSVLIAIMILPWALPGVVEGILWSGIWDSNAGVFNSLLKSLHLISHYHVFLGQNRILTIFAIELVQIWQITPLSTLLILASLQNIPHEIYESSTIEGCGYFKTLRYITIPLARPGIAIACIQAIIATLNIFDQPYVLNGAASTGASLNMEAYFTSFQNLDFGEGYAISLLITIFTLFVSIFVTKLLYKKVEF